MFQTIQMYWSFNICLTFSRRTKTWGAMSNMTICIRNSTEAENVRKQTQTLHCRANFKGHKKKTWVKTTGAALTAVHLTNRDSERGGLSVLGTRSSEPIKIKLGMKISWDTRLLSHLFILQIYKRLYTWGSVCICSAHLALKSTKPAEIKLDMKIPYNNNNRELIPRFTRLKAFYNLTKNIQYTNTHNYTDQQYTKHMKINIFIQSIAKNTHTSHVHTHKITHTQCQ